MTKINYLIKIEYDGTNFVGWQFQKNGKSVQEIVENALEKFFSIKVKITGAGRTDKGVHAMCQCANFLTKYKIKNKKKFLSSINFFLRNHLVSITDLKQKKKTLAPGFLQKKEHICIKLLIGRDRYQLIKIRHGTLRIN